MKNRDLCILTFREMRTEKKENFLYSIMVFFIVLCIIIPVKIAVHSDEITDAILKSMYKNSDRGYSFYLKGYTVDDLGMLQKMGFYNISISKDNKTSSGELKSIKNIWFYKIKALVEDKDIWSPTIDDILVVQLFCELILLTLSTIFFVLFCFILSNSLSMKVLTREKYIAMLNILGCSKKKIRCIFEGSYIVKNIIAIFMAEGVSCIFLKLINNYLEKETLKESNIPFFSPVQFGLLIAGTYVPVAHLCKNNFKDLK
jgi:hypothetical protein